MKIVKIIKSPRKNKRLRVYLDDNRYFDFGLDTGETFIDHQNEKKRDAYRKRHFANDTERYIIETLTPSPALFSWLLLWGGSSDLMTNIETLNAMLNKYWL
jgi:hypothetical protein